MNDSAAKEAKNDNIAGASNDAPSGRGRLATREVGRVLFSLSADDAGLSARKSIERSEKMKNLILTVAVVAAAIGLAASASKCRYCDLTGYGRGCVYAPDKVHRHIETDERCEYCGNTGYGRGCVHNPAKVHVHGSGNGKCVYCGLKSSGRGCVHAPDGVHRR